jgi:predicted peptidase
VIALRRALDVLLSSPNVDPKRLAFVGHSDGAELGAILAGVDHRIATAVLMGVGGRWDRSGVRSYNRLISPLDAINYLRYAAPVSLFIQSAHNDEFIPRKNAIAFQRAAGKPKVVKWYATSHGFDAEA